MRNRRTSAPARVAIIGVGLIGGSLAAALKRALPDVTLVGVDRSKRPPRSRVPLDQYSTDLKSIVGCDIVVLAAPVDINLRLLTEVRRLAGPETTITDVGSTKRAIVAEARRLRLHSQFVGGHPMAGLALSGGGHATPSLFDGAPWVITPERAELRHVRRVRVLVRAAGARPVVASAAAHDRVVAQVSHVPQLVVSCLMAWVGGDVGSTGLGLSGSGLYDTTRLATSSADVWAAIFAQNRDEIGRALSRFQQRLAAFDERLDSPRAIEHAFGDAQRWRRRLEQLRARRGARSR